MDTEEMYRRGTADAERDSINTFYYQHYYPYRRGYDEARRRLHRPKVPMGNRRLTPIWILLVFIIVAAAWLYFQRQSATTTRPIPTRVVLVSTNTPVATRTPILPTVVPTPTPTSTPKPIKIGVGSIVIVVEDGLRARRDANLKSPVVAKFISGEEVKIIGGPKEADGFTWWRISNANGTGWSAERGPDGALWLRAKPETP